MMFSQSFAGAVASVALISAAHISAAHVSAAHAADMQPVLKAPPVEQQATGYVEIYSGWAGSRVRERDCSRGECAPDEKFRLNGWALGGAGRGNYWVTRNVSVQVDAQAEGTSYDFPGRSGR